MSCIILKYLIKTLDNINLVNYYIAERRYYDTRMASFNKNDGRKTGESN